MFSIPNPFAQKPKPTKERDFFTLLGGWAGFHNESAFHYYIHNPILRFAINKRAEYISQANFYVKGDRGKEDPVLDLINSPNPLQSKSDYLFQLAVFTMLHGDSFMYPLAGDSFIKDPERSMLFNLPGNYVLNRNDYQVSISDFLESEDYQEEIKYQYTNGEDQIKFRHSEVMPVYDTANGVGLKLNRGLSKIDSLKKVLDNVNTALEGKNVVLDSPGGVGIISSSREMDGKSLPLTPDEKDNLQNKINNYGISKGKHKFLFTSANVNFQPFNISIDNFNFDEGIVNDAIWVMSAYNIPPEIAGHKNSTYENKEKAMLSVYQDCQSFVDNIAQKIGNWYGVEIEASFDHIPVVAESIQSSNKDKLNMFRDFSYSLNQLKSAGIEVSREEAFDQMKKMKIWAS